MCSICFQSWTKKQANDSFLLQQVCFSNQNFNFKVFEWWFHLKCISQTVSETKRGIILRVKVVVKMNYAICNYRYWHYHWNDNNPVVSFGKLLEVQFVYGFKFKCQEADNRRYSVNLFLRCKIWFSCVVIFDWKNWTLLCAVARVLLCITA